MTKQKKIILFDIDYTVFDLKLFRQSDLKTYQVYGEVHEVLSQLKNIAALGIFSQGDVAFQHRKLVETNIEQYFLKEHIHIVEEKFFVLTDIMLHYRNKGKLYLVDDRLPILAAAKQHYPEVVTIWVKRGVYAENQAPIAGFEPDATVLTLKEIVPFISSD